MSSASHSGKTFRVRAQRGIVRVFLFAAMLIGFGASSAWSVRLACADYWFRQQTLRGTEKALAFTPGQADYYVRLALLESGDNKPAAMEALKHAAALNPSDAQTWIELGLRYEAEGASPVAERCAEQCLLRAAEEDRQYLPRWTLANYYFRASQIDRFWFWAKQAAEMAPGDPAPLFRLCGRVAEDGALINRLNIGRADVRAAYVSYLLSQGRLDLMGPASRLLLNTKRVNTKRASDVPLLLTVCDRLLESKRLAGALEIWNGLADGRQIPFARLQVTDGKVLTNGDFRFPPTSRGFDWRLPTVGGVSASIDEGGGLRLTLSGSQPENCELLIQLVPVQEKTNYELKFEYQTDGIGPGSGLEWRITDQNGSRTLDIDAHSLSSERERQGKVSFVSPASMVPADRQIARMALTYKRVPGTTRIEGFIVLRRVELHATSVALQHS